jgi:hypothetical protein
VCPFAAPAHTQFCWVRNENVTTMKDPRESGDPDEYYMG